VGERGERGERSPVEFAPAIHGTMTLQYRQIDARSLYDLLASDVHPADTFFQFSFANC